MYKPLVSIVIAAYNGQKFISQQLNTILDQSYPSYEIIVVDDASSDDTWSVLEDYVRIFPTVFRIIRNATNLGWIKTFSKAFSYAKGDYVFYCDQDDLWLPNKLESIVNVFLQSQETSLVYHNSFYFSNNEITITPENMLEYVGQISNDLIQKFDYIERYKKFHFSEFEGQNALSLYWKFLIVGHTIAVRKDVCPLVSDVGNVPFDYILPIAASCLGKITHCKKYLNFHRGHDDALSPKLEVELSYNIRLAYYKKFQDFNKYLNFSDRKLSQKIYKGLERKGPNKFSLFYFIFLLKNRYRFLEGLKGGNMLSREFFRWRITRAWSKNW